ncbi:MDR family MFS transporter [Nocardioides jejuensis]|uniref:DHA2 family efflux MFS transporter permease subunit n=1 Tax=Nocardioides jejuensis TaxID=2502782 RepID=A0A4R1CI81_9ACTN|nr:MDR family MFS transporter [Nocardioides jejuensis]TCJ31164.1 DHA2 family efflux MFS transporter permease subunit [Nocardioides jejuensis]
MSASQDIDVAVVATDDSPDAPFTTPLVVKLLVAATFVVILNETTMINALPSLMRDFGIDERTSQWVNTVFMLTMASVIPLTGWFLQRVTTKTAFTVAMATFCTGTLLGMLAPSYAVLLVARSIQGAGTAVMMPLLMTTVMTVIPMAHRGRVMGNMMMAISVAPALGPTTSGLLLELGPWRLIFATILPLAIVMGVVGRRLVENIGEPKAGPVSWLSVLLAGGGFANLVYGLSNFGAGTLAKPVAFTIVGVLLVGAFVAYQIVLQGRGAPLLDLRTLRIRTFATAVLLMCAAFMAFFGAMVLLPLYLQNYRGLSTLQTGLLVMPGGLAMGLLGPRVGRVFDRVGTRPLVIPGAAGLVTALVVLSQVIDLSTPFWLIVVLHVALMSCLACVFTPVFTLGLGALPPELYSHGSSLLGTLQQVAGAAGMALLIAILQSRGDAIVARDHLTELIPGVLPPTAFVGGLDWALLTGACFGVVVFLMALLLPARTQNAAGAPAAH